MNNMHHSDNKTLELMVTGNNGVLIPRPAINAYMPDNLSHGNQSASISDYWIAWKKSLKYILLFILLSALAMLALGLLTENTYTSKASIKIETDHTRILEYDVDTSRPPSYVNDDIFYNTQYKLLRNRDLATKVIAELGIEDYLLEEKTFIKPVYRASEWLKTQVEAVKAMLPLPDTGNGKPERITAEEIFFERLNINPVRRSRVIDLHYTSQDPELSKQVLSTYISRFIRLQQEARLQSTDEAKEYLGVQIEKSREKMQEAEQKLIDYARKNKIVDTQADVSVIANNISLLNEAYIKAKSRRIDAESQYQNKKGISTLLNAGADPVIQAKKQELSSLQAEYKSRLSLFKPAYPEMLKLKQQIDQLQNYISRESNDIQANTSQNMKANFIASLEEEKKLKGEIQRLEADLMNFYEDSIGYTSLKRDVDTSRNLYEGLLQRQKEISVIGPVPGDNISVVDTASFPPRKDGLTYSKYIALGGFLGLVLYSMIVFLREMFSPRIRTESDLKQLSPKYPLLASIPKVRNGLFGTRQLSVVDAYDQRAAEALRYLRTSLQLSNTDNAIPQTIHITSPNAGEGKSTVAVFLATSLASTGKKVLLIDGDLRKPSLHKKLRINNDQGLTNFFYNSEIKAQKCYLHKSPIFFMAVAAGPAIADPVDCLGSNRFSKLVSKGREMFDHIIIDSPPVLGMADSLVISAQADCSLLIVTNNETRKHDTLTAINRLEEGHGRITGLVCNKTDNSYSKSYYNTRYADGRNTIMVTA